MSAQNELRLFISSTFRDMQEEREYLVKKIFPEVRALCRERGIAFTEVDLRWGLTDEEAALGRVIRTCLEEIDKCRPFFLGLVGERYGWVPDMIEYYKDPELFARWPWLEEAAMEESSITDIEFRHAALNDPEATRHARFFFRDLDTLPPADGVDPQLEELKSRVRRSGLAHATYDSHENLGRQVFDQLRAIIDTEFADARPPSALEEERSRHAAFSASRRHAYIPNPDYLRRLNEWYSSDEDPLILYAESGSGKSSLLAFWCDLVRRKEPEALVVEHYVGIGAGDSDHLGIIRHVIEEIREKYNRPEEVPTNPEELEQEFANWLGFGVGAPILLLLDGVNQLTGRAAELHWLPPVMPDGVRLVISSTVERTLVDLRARGWGELGMQPLSEREREAMIIRFLAEYRKALAPDQVAQIAHDPKSAHPLFLRTLLEELRLHGDHEELGGTILRLLSSTGTEDLFQKVLARFESDYGVGQIQEIMSLLWASRRGLSEEELEEISELSRLDLSTMLLGFDYHLLRNDGMLSFFHDYLRRAVEKRYLDDEQKRHQVHGRLAEYFANRELSVRIGEELLWQYEKSDQHDRLADFLGRVDVVLLLYGGTSKGIILSHWARLREKNPDIATLYRESINAYVARTGTEDHLAAYAMVGDLLEQLGIWNVAEEMYEDLVDEADPATMGGALADGEQRLAEIVQKKGRLGEAESRLTRALEIYQELGDRQGIARVYGNIGTLYARQSEFEKALEHYHISLGISEELGDRQETARAHGNIGLIDFQKGKHDEALKNFDKCLHLFREIGDRHAIANLKGTVGAIHLAMGNSEEGVGMYREALSIYQELGSRFGIAIIHGRLGRAHGSRGEYEKALQSYNVQLRMNMELGNRPGVAMVHGAIGIVYAHLGEYDRALEGLQRKLSICEETGMRSEVGTAVGDIGNLYKDYGEYGLALEYAARATTISREIGDDGGLCHWPLTSAEALLRLTEVSERMPEYLPQYVPEATPDAWILPSLLIARKETEECNALSKEISNQSTLFVGRLLLARITAAEGDVRGGIAMLQEILEETEGEEARAELHYYLHTLGAADSDHATTAADLFTDLYEKIPNHLYQKRLAALRTIPSV